MYAIYLPVVPREFGELALLAAAWRIFKPASSEIMARTDLYISVDMDEHISGAKECCDFFKGFGFRKIHVFSAGLSKEESIYIKNDAAIDFIPTYGLKSGPNLQWLKIQTHLSGLYNVSLQCEVDMFPLCDEWFSKAIQEIDLDSLICGAIYRGPTRLGGEILSHINGNALYRTDHLHHQKWVKFVNDCILHEVEMGNKSVAFDTAPHFIFYKFMSEGASRLYKQNFGAFIHDEDCLRYVISRYRYTHKIANYSGFVEMRDMEIFDASQVIRDYFPNCVLFHSSLLRSHMASLICNSKLASIDDKNIAEKYM